jgi:hypothetical protein
MESVSTPWWERRSTAAALVLLAALPLLWPTIPPLVDLPGHMAGYKVELDLASSPYLQRYYGYEWRLIGNLGINLLIIPLSSVFGLELALKLIVLCIPPLLVTGFLWTAREIHGRIPPTALFAIPFAYNFPFMFGFINFTLGMGLCFIAFAFWLRLGRQERWRTRAILFVPIGLLLWLCHTMAWAVLGAMAFAEAFVRARQAGRPLLEAGYRAGLSCLPLIPPALLMIVWRSGQYQGRTEDWFNIPSKLKSLIWPLRDRWWWLDWPSYGVILLLLAWPRRDRRIGYAATMGMAALLLLLAFLIAPRHVFGSSYADMRLVPYLFAAAILALRLRSGGDPRFARAIAAAGLAFVLLRTAGTTASLWLYDRAYENELAALDHVPRGARLVSFVGTQCRETWEMTRLEHLPGMAVVRREAFSNDQWRIPGVVLIDSHYAPAGQFGYDPSQVIELRPCTGNHWRTAQQAIGTFPRQAFDYLWLINPPPLPAGLLNGLEPIWSNGRSGLFRIVHSPAEAASPPLPAGAAR